jgi:hypothetical protein
LNLISQRLDTIYQIKPKHATVLFLHLFTELNTPTMATRCIGCQPIFATVQVWRPQTEVSKFTATYCDEIPRFNYYTAMAGSSYSPIKQEQNCCGGHIYGVARGGEEPNSLLACQLGMVSKKSSAQPAHALFPGRLNGKDRFASLEKRCPSPSRSISPASTV